MESASTEWRTHEYIGSGAVALRGTPNDGVSTEKRVLVVRFASRAMAKKLELIEAKGKCVCEAKDSSHRPAIDRQTLTAEPEIASAESDGREQFRHRKFSLRD